MKKRVSKLLALALTATMLLSACGNNSGETAQTEKAEEGKESTEQTTEKTEEGKKDKAEASADEIKDLVIARLATREIESFNILYSQTFSDFENLTNLTDPLLEVDTHGKLVACLSLIHISDPILQQLEADWSNGNLVSSDVLCHLAPDGQKHL